MRLFFGLLHLSWTVNQPKFDPCSVPNCFCGARKIHPDLETGHSPTQMQSIMDAEFRHYQDVMRAIQAAEIFGWGPAGVALVRRVAAGR